MLRLYLICTCLALFLASCSSSASQRPNFTGEWVIDKAATKIEAFDISRLESASFVIDHREPNFKFQRTWVLDGKKQLASYELLTDGKEVTLSNLGLGTYARLYWEGDALVFAARIGGADGDSTDTVHYRLTAGGSRLEADESHRSPSWNHDDHWVATKK